MSLRPPLIVPFAIAAALAIAPPFTPDSHSATITISLEEESIPGADLSSPGAPAPSPASEATPSGADWEQLPASQASPGAKTVEVPAVEQPPAARASPAAPVAASGPTPEPTDVPPAMDAGSMAAALQVSDVSLTPLIKSAQDPARAVSMQIAEQARIEIEGGRNDDAIRELSHAVSIDPTNPYVYFYLGRGYGAKKDFTQAVTFFRRAEIGLAQDPAWLGETYAFEGQCYERAGQPADAAASYRKALAESPGNLTARTGYTRLAAYAPTPAAGPSPGEAEQPAAADTIPAAPKEAPPAPASDD